jgi:hypothetical protein
MRSIYRLLGLLLIGAILASGGCARRPPAYGVERQLHLPTTKRQVWAVAPAIDLSGQQIDPILQADLLFQQLQQVRGLTVIPVNRVVEVYASLGLERVQSEQQAAVVAEMLGCDALVVPTVTAFDPYNPPTFGVALQLFTRRGAGAVAASQLDVRELVRQAAPREMQPQPATGHLVQVVGMFDASSGSVREALWQHSRGRSDPVGPMGAREYLLSMDRYCSFVYHTLVADLLRTPQVRRI